MYRLKRYRNLENYSNHFSKLGYKTICGEVINWDNTLINKLKNDGKFTQLDIDYICQLLHDDIDLMKIYIKEHKDKC